MTSTQETIQSIKTRIATHNSNVNLYEYQLKTAQENKAKFDKQLAESGLTSETLEPKIKELEATVTSLITQIEQQLTAVGA